MMRYASVHFICAAIIICLSRHTFAGEVQLDFFNTVNSGIHFSKGTFAFVGPGFPQPGSGLHQFILYDGGDITGTFTIGPITGTEEQASAPVSGKGTFTIDDGVGHTLSADLVWNVISKSHFNSNDPGELSGRLSNISYTGSASGLEALASDHAASIALEFMVLPGPPWYPSGNSISLFGLNAGTPVPYDFIGRVTGTPVVVPEPGSVVLALAGAPALGAWWMARRDRRSQRLSATT
ncbi:MAG TPA: hypothetical protein VG826_13790 [Pirellulales bacterium]|nr:hypothetical protein [Pirellulales bacterium]